MLNLLFPESLQVTMPSSLLPLLPPSAGPTPATSKPLTDAMRMMGLKRRHAIILVEAQDAEARYISLKKKTL